MIPFVFPVRLPETIELVPSVVPIREALAQPISALIAAARVGYLAFEDEAKTRFLGEPCNERLVVSRRASELHSVGLSVSQRPPPTPT